MQQKRELPIGLFDSGVGGLTVFKAIADLMPNEHLIYLGDTARVPYGTKSPETIVRYTQMAASALIELGIKMLVIACNTATSAALPILRAAFAPMPVIGVVEPGARAAVAASKNGRIAVIGTEATINGMAYQRAIQAIHPQAKVTARACTLFVPLAEEGWVSGSVPLGVAQKYLGDIFDSAALDARPDTLLLGCTHFPLLLEVLRETTGPDVSIVDSASATAVDVARKLEELDMTRTDASRPRKLFLTTDNLERFRATGGMFLGSDMRSEQVELVDLCRSKQ